MNAAMTADEAAEFQARLTGAVQALVEYARVTRPAHLDLGDGEVVVTLTWWQRFLRWLGW